MEFGVHAVLQRFVPRQLLHEVANDSDRRSRNRTHNGNGSGTIFPRTRRSYEEDQAPAREVVGPHEPDRDGQVRPFARERSGVGRPLGTFHRKQLRVASRVAERAKHHS